ncbi:MAG: glycosyltransferase family 2 protein [Candidatus Omnitrophica bacterium]|nr:glycosyltransferase family 2 protein [Candidatus Omnitrophota bacterium]
MLNSVEYSIVVPVYNEEESLSPLFQEILEAMTPLGKPFEVIFINDCSSDRSLEILKGFQKEFPHIVIILDLKERHGQTFAMREGLDAARGKVVTTLDADLQNDPADIPKLFQKMAEGNYEVVSGWRKNRQDTAVKAFFSKFGNILQRTLTGLKIHDVSCTLRAYKRECINRIPLNLEGQHRFIPLALSLQGYRVGEIVSNHRRRKFGQTKYSHKRFGRVIKDFFRTWLSGGRS